MKGRMPYREAATKVICGDNQDKKWDLLGQQKDGVRTALRDRQEDLSELVEAIRKYRKLAEKTPMTLQGSDFAQAVEDLNKSIDRAEGLMLH
jgi:hypothetical protein